MNIEKLFIAAGSCLGFSSYILVWWLLIKLNKHRRILRILCEDRGLNYDKQ